MLSYIYCIHRAMRVDARCSTGEFHAGFEAFESNTPLFDCCINDVVTEHYPFLHETHMAAIDSLLENAPNFVIDRIQIGTVWRP